MLSFAARVLSDPEAFISYVGADNKIADPVMEDPSGLNRSRVSIVPGKALSREREREDSLYFLAKKPLSFVPVTMFICQVKQT